MTRVGIVGAGAIAAVHARAWAGLDVSVSAYSRSGTASLSPFHVQAVTSLSELIDRADLVDVCTPTPTHLPIAAAALEAGRDVLCEKPLALTVEDAVTLVDRADRAGRRLFVGHVLRHFPPYAAAKRVVDDGVLGRPAVARFVREGEFPSWGSWFADDEQSGGILLDQMIHDLDMARWVFGPVRRVHAVSSVAAAASPARSAHVLLAHTNGAISSVTGIWGAPGLRFSARFSIAGSDGVVTHDSAGEGGIRLDTGDPARQESGIPDGVGDPFSSQLAEVLAALAGGAVPLTTASDGVEAVRLARAAIESVRSGAPVVVEGAA